MKKMSTEDSREQARTALEQARRQLARIDEQAPQVAEEAGLLGRLLERNHLAPRMRRAMRLRWSR